MTWKKLAGRGALGNVNWGVDFDDKKSLQELQPLLKEIKKYIDKRVLLTGGGGFGSHIGILKGAKIGEMAKGCFRIEVTLEKLDPPLAGDTTFTPWLDSWQISVEED